MEYNKDYFGFVYIWYNSKNFRMSRGGTIDHPWLYVGSHMGSKDDVYVSSQPKLNEAYRKNRTNFRRKIVHWHPNESRQELYDKENEWLALIEKEELGIKFYNLTKNAFGPEGCDLKRLWQDPNFRAKQDASWTPERREAQRQTKLIMWAEPGRKENWSTFQKELWDNPEHRAKVMASLVPLYANTEIHDAHSRHMTDLWAPGSDYRAKHEAQRKDPEYRAKLSTALTNIPRRRPQKIPCPHCSREFNPGPYARSHGDKCKMKPL